MVNKNRWYGPEGGDKVLSTQVVPSSGQHKVTETPNGTAAVAADQYTSIILLGVQGEAYARMALSPGSIHISDGTDDPTFYGYLTNFDIDGLQAYSGGPFLLQTGSQSVLSIGRTNVPAGPHSDVATQLVLQAGATQGSFPLIRLVDAGGTPILDIDPVTADVKFLKAGAGPIIKDRADGHTYRIKSTNGVLGLEQVT